MLGPREVPKKEMECRNDGRWLTPIKKISKITGVRFFLWRKMRKGGASNMSREQSK